MNYYKLDLIYNGKRTTKRGRAQFFLYKDFIKRHNSDSNLNIIVVKSVKDISLDTEFISIINRFIWKIIVENGRKWEMVGGDRKLWEIWVLDGWDGV
jgi:hypothetical protein